MTEQEIWKRFTALPDDAQDQVAELISFLHEHLSAETEVQPKQSKAETEFFGIWRDRKDVREQRASLVGFLDALRSEPASARSAEAIESAVAAERNAWNERSI